MDGFDAIPMFSKKKLRILESIRTIQMAYTENIVLVMRVIGSTDVQTSSTTYITTNRSLPVLPPACTWTTKCFEIQFDFEATAVPYFMVPVWS